MSINTTHTPLQRWSWRRPESEWFSGAYSVKERFLPKICTHPKMDPIVDAFSCEESSKCVVWLGPGSQIGQDAMTQLWSNIDLWLNPLFSLLKVVVDKVVTDLAHALHVMPDWSRRTWFKKAMRMSRRNLLFPGIRNCSNLTRNPVRVHCDRHRLYRSVALCHDVQGSSQGQLSCLETPKASVST